MVAETTAAGEVPEVVATDPGSVSDTDGPAVGTVGVDPRTVPEVVAVDAERRRVAATGLEETVSEAYDGRLIAILLSPVKPESSNCRTRHTPA